MKKITGGNLRFLRKRFGVRKITLAKYLDVKKKIINLYESGKLEMPVIQIENLSDLFGIDSEMFFCENKEDIKSNLNLSNIDLPIDTLKNIASFNRIVKNYLLIRNKIKQSCKKDQK